MGYSRIRLYVHFAWSTWDRAPLTEACWRARLYACRQAEAHSLGCETIAVGGTDDHVHALVRLLATVSVAQLAKQMKGASSHLINHMGWSEDFRWQGTYCAETVAEDGIAAVSAYIHDQDRRHRSAP